MDPRGDKKVIPQKRGHIGHHGGDHRSSPKLYGPSGGGDTLFFEGSPFCHHEGRRKRWEFLNRCTFRFRSTPSSFFPTQQIGFGAAGRVCSIVEFSRHVFHCCPVFFLGERRKSRGKKSALHRPPGGRALALWAQRQPYGPNDNPI